MNFFIENWFLFAAALASGGLLLWPTLSGGAQAGSVGTSEAVRLINREKGVLIDVCEASEFASAHAAGARNVPLSQIAGHKLLPTNKALPLLVMCARGNRARGAVAALRKAGYERALVVAGGNAAWRDAQLPMEKSA